MQDIFLAIIKKNISMEALNWLEEKTELVKTESKSLQLNLTFSQLPRHTGKALVAYQDVDLAQISESLPGFSIKGWTVDRLCRVWLLTQIPAFDKDTYLKKINSLVIGAEMNELAAPITRLLIFLR